MNSGVHTFSDEEAPGGFWQVPLVAHLVPVAYGLWLAVVAAQGREIRWPEEAVKVLVIYGAGLYVAFLVRRWQRQLLKQEALIRQSQGIVKRLETDAAELEGARARAEAANAVKTRFLANMSYEIRTPMNAVLGISDMLLLGDLDDEQRRWIDMLRGSGGRLLNVIDDVLDFSRIDAGEMSLERIQCKLGPLVEDMVQPLRSQAEARGLTLAVELSKDLPDKVVTDPVRLRQALMSLISNAIKYTDRGGVTVRVSVEELGQGEHDKVWILFEVVDTGVGIKKDLQGWLFEPFAQDDALARERGGAGLGLPIAQRLIELMGGEIGVKSEVGKGSTFYFSLPLTPTDDPTVELGRLPLAPPTAETERELQSGEVHRVLLVEDDAVNRVVAEHLLASFGLDVMTAVNGREAIAAMDDGPFDAILMDCKLPEVDGFQATEEIRRREGSERRTPIVALTARALDGDRERCLRVGMDGYLAKPLTRDALADVLSTWIDLKG